MLLLGVHFLLPLSSLYLSGASTLPLRPSWCPLEQPGQSGTCVSEPWQALIQSKCLSWFLPGMDLIPGIKCQSVASCESPLRHSTSLSLPSQYAKWEAQGELCWDPTQGQGHTCCCTSRMTGETHKGRTRCRM